MKPLRVIFKLRNGFVSCASLVLFFSGIPNAHAQTYFEKLVNRSDYHSSTDLGSTQEVVDQLNFSKKERATTAYDPTMDAAKFIVPPNTVSVIGDDQVRHNFPFVGSGNLLFYWEARASSYWVRDGDVDGVQTNKAFQLSRGGSDPGAKVSLRACGYTENESRYDFRRFQFSS